MKNLTFKQYQKLKSSIIDLNNCINKVFPFFNKLYKELSPGFQLVDNFPDCFSFCIVKYKDIEVKNAHIHTFDKIFENSFLNPNTILVIPNTSINNNIAILILNIQSGRDILARTIHHMTNITFMEVELFLIRCGINQAI